MKLAISNCSRAGEIHTSYHCHVGYCATFGEHFSVFYFCASRISYEIIFYKIFSVGLMKRCTIIWCKHTICI